jgi:hypothetical protein
MQERKGAQLGWGEERRPLAAHLLMDGAHDLREGFQHRLGTLAGQVRRGHGTLPPWPHTGEFGGGPIIRRANYPWNRSACQRAFLSLSREGNKSSSARTP